MFDQIECKSLLPVRPIALGISSKLKGLLVMPKLKRHFDYLEADLTEHGAWFVGRSFSAAHVKMSVGIEAPAARGLLKNRTKLADWLRRIHERPAYQRALEQGGPFLIWADSRDGSPRRHHDGAMHSAPSSATLRAPSITMLRSISAASRSTAFSTPARPPAAAA